MLIYYTHRAHQSQCNPHTVTIAEDGVVALGCRVVDVVVRRVTLEMQSKLCRARSAYALEGGTHKEMQWK